LELIEAALETARREYGEAQAAGDRDGLAKAGRFRIVGEDEADPKNGSISQVSPLARSLFNKRVATQ
jgi:hypothetical protein